MQFLETHGVHYVSEFDDVDRCVRLSSKRSVSNVPDPCLGLALASIVCEKQVGNICIKGQF